MKFNAFILIFLSFFFLQSCDKEDATALAKNKALKEKVAMEMKKATQSDKKKTSKTKAKSTTKKSEAKKPTKKIDPVLANQPAAKSGKNKKDDAAPAEKKGAQLVSKKTPKKIIKAEPKQITYPPAVIEIVANFDEADATINGIAYPEYTPQGEDGGMILPAGGPYNVEVNFGAKVKYYEIFLKPNETRILFVSSGGGSSPKKKYPKKSVKTDKKKSETKKGEKAPGKVTIYGKPKGKIIVDGSEQSESTPGTIELENGRHEIQVKYSDSGELSEKKIVRVRSGSKIKLFFRERKK